jgi:hypothetical protein
MAKKPERNDPCHCGSNKKYKNCCMEKDNSKLGSKAGMVVVGLVVLLTLVIAFMVFSGGNPPVDCPPGTVWSDAHQHCH